MTTMTLPRRCDRGAASSFHPELCEALSDQPVTIDASKVEQVGQAMLQVLASAALSEGGVILDQPSEELCASLKLTGLDELLLEGATK